jgi:uncharacterized membrane protein YvbJ
MAKKRTLNELRQNKTYGYRQPVDTTEELRNKFAKSIKALDEARQREMEQYANQRVIEELEKVVNNSVGIKNGSGELFVSASDIQERIKELKQ